MKCDYIDWRKEFLNLSDEHEELLEAYTRSRKRESELLSVIALLEELEEEWVDANTKSHSNL